MLLAIDCGNTNTVFAIWDGSRFLCTLRTSTHHARTADAYFTWFSTLVKHYGLSLDITDVIISSTVPRVVFNLRVFADRFFGCRPLVVGKPDCDLPAHPRVDAGTQVGPDRLVNTAGAHDRHGGDLIVVDFGTATTFDVALHQMAAALPHIDVTTPQKVIGTNTVDCMQSGVFWGYVGLVNGITRRIRAEYDRPMRVIGTGGLAPLFAQGDLLFDVIEDDLTMHGLTVIHAHNKKG